MEKKKMNYKITIPITTNKTEKNFSQNVKYHFYVVAEKKLVEVLCQAI